jgi:hypothetical protein
VASISPVTVQAYLHEAAEDEVCKSAAGSVQGRSLGQISSPDALYALCRILKPLRVVETGIASGLSSTFILEALSKNQHGQLYSIDMPNYEEVLAERNIHPYQPGSPGTIPPGLSTGWLVPDVLRLYWKVELGLTSERLPSLLNMLQEIDIFLHDSEHTYGNMYWEYSTAWRYLRRGGLLLSHDVRAFNSAFFDFAKNVRQEPYTIGDIGALRKT